MQGWADEVRGVRGAEVGAVTPPPLPSPPRSQSVLAVAFAVALATGGKPDRHLSDGRLGVCSAPFVPTGSAFLSFLLSDAYFLVGGMLDRSSASFTMIICFVAGSGGIYETGSLDVRGRVHAEMTVDTEQTQASEHSYIQENLTMQR